MTLVFVVINPAILAIWYWWFDFLPSIIYKFVSCPLKSAKYMTYKYYL